MAVGNDDRFRPPPQWRRPSPETYTDCLRSRKWVAGTDCLQTVARWLGVALK